MTEQQLNELKDKVDFLMKQETGEVFYKGDLSFMDTYERVYEKYKEISK